MHFTPEPPDVVIHPDNGSSIDAGYTHVLSCVAYGDPVPTITWSRAGGNLANNTRVTISEDIVTEGTANFAKTVLEICSTEGSDSDQYSCVASSAAGNDSIDLQIKVITVGGKNCLFSLVAKIIVFFPFHLLPTQLNS